MRADLEIPMLSLSQISLWQHIFLWENHTRVRGSGLKQFEKAFRTIATHSGWPDVVAAVNLKDNLNGSAKVVVLNLEADDDDYEPTVDEIFLALRKKFGGTEAKLDAKAKYLKVSQRPSESVANFTSFKVHG